MTETTQLRRWLEDLEVPAGLETDLLAGIRRRRRAQAVRSSAVALATVAVLTAGSVGLPWHDLGQRLGVVPAGPAAPGPFEECDPGTGDGNRTPGGLELTTDAALGSLTSGTSTPVRVVVTNTGDRPVVVDGPVIVRLCVRHEKGSAPGEDVVVSGFGQSAGTAGPRWAITLGPGRSLHLGAVWDLAACRADDDGSEKGCHHGGPAEPGDYRVQAAVRLSSGGRVWTLFAPEEAAQVVPMR